MIKPEGLKLPDCKCFRVQARKMQLQINQLSAIHVFEMIGLGDNMNICDRARDYFVSIFVANTVSTLIKRRKNDNYDAAASYQEDFEAAYDRIKPLVMQHLDFIDGMSMEIKG